MGKKYTVGFEYNEGIWVKFSLMLSNLPCSGGMNILPYLVIPSALIFQYEHKFF